MSKGKRTRKPSQLQRDPAIIEGAKYLKRHGLLSKQAKLHSGKYVSPSVAKKVRHFIDNRLIDGGYVGVKVSRETLRKAKAQGFEVSNGRIVSPPDRTFINRLKRGELAGVIPVKGGAMEVVTLPHDIMSMRRLIERGGKGALDQLKAPGENFAFKLYGHWSKQPFRDSQHMIDYLMRYQNFEELEEDPYESTFQNFEIYRLRALDVGPLFASINQERAQEAARRKRERKASSGGSSSNDRSRLASERAQRKRENMNPARLARMQKRKAEKQAEYRENLKNDAAKYEERKRKDRERAQRNRDRNKKS